MSRDGVFKLIGVNMPMAQFDLSADLAGWIILVAQGIKMIPPVPLHSNTIQFNNIRK